MRKKKLGEKQPRLIVLTNYRMISVRTASFGILKVCKSVLVDFDLIKVTREAHYYDMEELLAPNEEQVKKNKIFFSFNGHLFAFDKGLVGSALQKFLVGFGTWEKHEHAIGTFNTKKSAMYHRQFSTFLCSKTELGAIPEVGRARSSIIHW